MSAAALMAMAATFNLVCSGSGLTVIGAEPNTKTTEKDFNLVYRIDLDSRRYCIDKCESTSKLEAVTSTELVFKFVNESETFSSYVKVNRESGAYLSTFKMGQVTSMQFGKCVPAPFTGFPTRKF
jgi:nitrate reductase NapAB chaperone NapD